MRRPKSETRDELSLLRAFGLAGSRNTSGSICLHLGSIKSIVSYIPRESFYQGCIRGSIVVQGRVTAALSNEIVVCMGDRHIRCCHEEKLLRINLATLCTENVRVPRYLSWYIPIKI